VERTWYCLFIPGIDVDIYIVRGLDVWDVFYHFRWCLYLRHLSSSAYELLRNSGILKLPSQRTLRDYTYYTEAATGFSSSVDQQLMDTANIFNCPERDRNVVILLDEMHVREDIVYDKHSGTCMYYLKTQSRVWYIVFVHVLC